MTDIILPWSPYEGRNSIFSHGRKALTAAFADAVRTRAGFEPQELPEIFAAAEDDGENDAARDLVRLDAEHLARTFSSGRLETFARPLGGGKIVPVDQTLWEVDDVLPRFATGAFNMDQWADAGAPSTHRIFVDCAAFDAWLAALKPFGPLNRRQVEEIVDPQLRAARAVATRQIAHHPETANNAQEHLQAAGNLAGVGPELLSIDEEIDLIGRSRSTIYDDEKKGAFPRRLKLGSSTRWMKSEVLAWIAEQAAKRGGD